MLKALGVPPDPHRHLEGIPFPSEANGKITEVQANFKSPEVLPKQDQKTESQLWNPDLTLDVWPEDFLLFH